jgi:glycosyl transferase family 25
MKIIVINLEDSKDRLQKITNNLNQLELPFERFNAISGVNLSDDQIENRTTFLCRNILCNYGIIGCALSHITLWKDFMKTKDEYICVIEDDAEFNDNFPVLLKNVDYIYKQLEFDMLSLHCIGLTFSFSKEIKIENYTFNKPLFPLTTTCYLLSKKGAKKLLKNFEKAEYNIDFMIAWRNLFSNNLDYYYLKKPTVIINDFADSTINTKQNSILTSIFNILNLHQLSWFLTIPVLTIQLSYSISLYFILLLIGLAISIKLEKYVITSFILFEIFLIHF